MAKKFSALLAVIAAVAFAVPAFASAAPEFTVGGAKAAVGTKFTGTSNNFSVVTSIGNLTCASSIFHAELTANNGVTVEAKGTGDGTTLESCFYKGVTPIDIHDFTVFRLHTNTPGKGTADLTFVATLPKGLVCHYIGTNVPFSYTLTTDVIRISGPLTTTPEFCGTASFQADFTLTSGAGAVVFH